MKTLSTAPEIIEVLGGITAVANLTGRQYKAAQNWKSFGRFPSNTYLTLHSALRERGCNAPPELWGMWQDQSA